MKRRKEGEVKGGIEKRRKRRKMKDDR